MTELPLAGLDRAHSAHAGQLLYGGMSDTPQLERLARCQDTDAVRVLDPARQ